MIKDRNTMLFIVIAAIVILVAVVFKIINKNHEMVQTKHLYEKPSNQN